MNEWPASSVDVHHHAILPRYRDELERLGVGAQPGVGFPAWSPEASLAWLDGDGVDRALLSVASPGFFFGDHAHTVRLTEMCNEDLARVRDRYPGRFGIFAAVPLPCLAEALAQAERALDDGFDGVALLTGYRGRSLASPRWTELFGLLHGREAVVHVHPTAPHPWPPDADTRPSLLEYPFETTRVFVGMARGRVFSRFPGIRWIFSHGGGTVPFLSDRLTGGTPASAIDGAAGGAIDGGDTIAEALDVSRFDTALCGAPALAALTEFAGRERLVFGSDPPFVSPDRASRLRRDHLRWTVPSATDTAP